MEFEFVQIQRFKNADDGQFVAVISPLEVPNRTTVRVRARLEHDRNSYAERGIPEDRLDRLDTAVEDLEKLCEEESWGLAPRRLKNAVKFQTGGGRNVFAIEIRRRNDHRMRFILGKDFDPTSCQLTETVKSALKQRPGTRFWSVPLQTAPIPDYRPLSRRLIPLSQALAKIRYGSRPSVPLATTDFCSSIRKRCPRRREHPS